MATDISSSDLALEKSLSYYKTASANDRREGALRHESDLQDISQARRDGESHLRQIANMEVGRARNLSRVI